MISIINIIPVHYYSVSASIPHLARACRAFFFQHFQMPTVVIIGSGLIGMYVGLNLRRGGINVYFVGRSQIWKDDMDSLQNISVSSIDSPDVLECAPKLQTALSITDIKEKIDFVIVAVKRIALENVGKQLHSSAYKGTICTLMNGVDSISVLRKSLGNASNEFVEGVWSTNVVRKNANWHMGSSGYCYLQQNEKGIELSRYFNDSRLQTKTHPDIVAVQYGKLLMNLNNAINALSGLPLQQQLGDYGHRRILANSILEALKVYEKSGIEPVSLTSLPFRVLPAVMLYTPSIIFNLLKNSIVKVDENATSSMYEDIKAKRETEIEYLQGEIVRLADLCDHQIPFNRAVYERIKERQEMKLGIVPMNPDDILDI